MTQRLSKLLSHNNATAAQPVKMISMVSHSLCSARSSDPSSVMQKVQNKDGSKKVKTHEANPCVCRVRAWDRRNKTLETFLPLMGSLWRRRSSICPVCLPAARCRYCLDQPPVPALKRAANDLPWNCVIFVSILQPGRCVQV